MKTTSKFAALTLATCSALCALSQPVLEAEDICPKAGETFLYNNTLFTMENTEGEGLVWDFTALELTEGFLEMAVISPVDGKDDVIPPEVLFLYDESYGAWGVTCSDDSLTALYRTTDHPRFKNPMHRYSDPLKFLEFPLNYGDRFTDRSYVEDNYNTDVITEMETSVTGYGTLKLPNLTVEEVLQVKTTGEVSNLWMNKDRTAFREKHVTPETIYSYWAKGYSFPLLKAVKLDDDFSADFLLAKLPDAAQTQSSGIVLYDDSVRVGIREDIVFAGLYDLQMNKLVEWRGKDFVRNKYGHHSMKYNAPEPGFYIFVAKTKDKTYYAVEQYRSY